ncbi:MAG: 2-C-methyl-D-erythritol 4-phosphate cytidylyltransferase [Phycisphaerae bacterium]|nr:2-C-methyl-D-erythritol 4-phosphate cytidylyltransferase [Phycisphaerae bacterium]MDW8262181.1 IspD/TarI family cytidylyltransferase [Phycisphaerales bacterium]
MGKLAVILAAGGSGSRFGGDKLGALIDGKSVLDRAIAAFEGRPEITQIIIAGRMMAARAGLTVTPPGTSRAQTVELAVAAVDERIEWIAVHDAARPLVSQGLIDRVIEEALRCGAAAPAVPVAATIKRASGPLPATVAGTLPRQELWAVQTPQIMRRADLLEAYRRCPIPLEQVTDDVQLLELIGRPVRLVEGEERNLKITRPADLLLAELLLKA